MTAADPTLSSSHVMHPSHPDRPGDDDALPEDFGRVAAAPVLGEHGVADVAADPREMVVEGMSDRRPPDDTTGDVGDQECRRDDARWQARADPLVSKPLKVLTPLRSLLKSPTEVEPLGDHRAMRGTEGFLVRDPERPELQVRTGDHHSSVQTAGLPISAGLIPL